MALKGGDSFFFAGAKIIRRILGLAHNIDFEWIEDKALRAACEARALRLGRELMVNTASFSSIGAVTDAVTLLGKWKPSFAS